MIFYPIGHWWFVLWLCVTRLIYPQSPIWYIIPNWGLDIPNWGYYVQLGIFSVSCLLGSTVTLNFSPLSVTFTLQRLNLLYQFDHFLCHFYHNLATSGQPGSIKSLTLSNPGVPVHPRLLHTILAFGQWNFAVLSVLSVLCVQCLYCVCTVLGKLCESNCYNSKGQCGNT